MADRSFDSDSAPLLLLQLNQLLEALSLPIVLTSHLELTPSLLIALLESILQTRLPLPDSVRAGLQPFSPHQYHSESRIRQKQNAALAAKVQATKIFLGVLQNDLVGQDVGISAMDPGRLARGEDVETRYVARLLCWYARKAKLIAKPGRPRGTGHDSPETATMTPTATQQSVSGDGAGESVTSYSPESDKHDPAPPRCIHEVPSPSASPDTILSPLAGPHLTTLPSPTLPSALLAAQNTTGANNSTVRYEGFIAVVDEDAEVAAFEARRDALHSLLPPVNWEQEPEPDPRDLEERRQRHAGLLRQKASLLAQLAASMKLDAESPSVSSSGPAPGSS
uniref:Uncharacterized protein n=1 Tax=Mycena chlorophos TaxID=658473 RepID=A0ABQ0LND5_MYCCL|nr:predicted protein [Mycena chlorophos]